MSDFKNLAPVAQASIQVKLDGFIEAAIHTCRAGNIGLTEALDLTIRAVLREIAAHKFDPGLTEKIWIAARTEILADCHPVNVTNLN